MGSQWVLVILCLTIVISQCHSQQTPQVTVLSGVTPSALEYVVPAGASQIVLEMNVQLESDDSYDEFIDSDEIIVSITCSACPTQFRNIIIDPFFYGNSVSIPPFVIEASRGLTWDVVFVQRSNALSKMSYALSLIASTISGNLALNSDSKALTWDSYATYFYYFTVTSAEAFLPVYISASGEIALFLDAKYMQGNYSAFDVINNPDVYTPTNVANPGTISLSFTNSTFPAIAGTYLIAILCPYPHTDDSGTGSYEISMCRGYECVASPTGLNNTTLYLIIGLSAGGGIMLIIGIVCLCKNCRRINPNKLTSQSKTYDLDMATPPHQYIAAKNHV